MVPGILLAGEPMGLYIAQEEGPIDQAVTFRAAVAGAEFNVAVGLTRLGHRVEYLTRLGCDPDGERIRRALRETGVGDALVITDPERPTGIMFKGRVSRGDPPIFYRRRGSAAAALSREDVERLDLSAFGCLHLTGILPALSPCALDAAEYLVDKARAAGLFISFDPNLRPQLWPSPAVMAETVNRLAARADLFLPGAGEGERLMGSADPAAIARHYQRLGVRYVVVKTGKTGAYAAGEGEAFQSPTYQETAVVDTVGAGDGFAAGVISALREGLSLREAVRRGNATGTIQIQHEGDNEGLPTREALEEFMTHTPLKTAEEASL